MIEYPLSPGFDWGMVIAVLVGMALAAGAFVNYLKARQTGNKSDWTSAVVLGLCALGSIPVGILLYSYASASIVLDEDGLSVRRRPVYSDRRVDFNEVKSYKVTTLYELGGLSDREGYSDGTEYVGWFRIGDGRRVLTCTVHKQVMFIEARDGGLMILGPADSADFFREFSERMERAVNTR